jgi:PAS domain S-box-containing protein
MRRSFVTLLSGAVAALLGGVALAGWTFHLPALTRLGPSFSPMAPNAAAGLLAVGAALLSIAFGRPRIAPAAGVWCLLAGGLTLVEYCLLLDLHIDQLLVSDYIHAYRTYAGRMAPNAAVCLFLCGLALLRAPASRRHSIASGAMGAVTLAVGIASLTGYLTGVPMQAWGNWTPMSANAAIGFVAAGLGIMIFAWQSSGSDKESQPHWLALAAGCGGLTISLCLAFSLYTREADRALPEIVIVVGAVISILMAFVIELAFASQRRADAAESLNTKLLQEAEARRDAEKNLHSTYSELEVIHANAPVVLLVLDDHFRVEKANDPAGRFARCEPQDMLGLRHGAAIGCLHSLDDPRGCGHGPSCGECALRLAALDTLCTGTRHQGVEAWVPVCHGGREESRCLLISTAPIELDHSKKVLICAQDMTEHKRDELELQRQARLIDFSEDAIIRTDARGTIQGWNSGAEEMYGWTVPEGRGKGLHSLVKTQPAIAAGIDAILLRDGRWAGELSHTRRDGRRIVVESRHVLVRDHAGDPVEILQINRDITERKKTERELSQSYRRMAAILDGISDGFTFFDRQWRYVHVNPAAARLMRMTRADLLGKTLWELWPHADGSALGEACRRAVAEKIPVQVEAFFPEPLNAWWEVRCYPSHEGLSLFFSDTTQRKRAAEELSQTVGALKTALAEKTVLLKEVHHRVKNNLAVIASLLSMKAGTTDNPEARRALDESQQRIHSMALIHEHLYSGERMDRVEFSEYARELVEQLYSASVSERELVAFDFDSSPVELGVHRAIPCALILNELLANVFKHAFPHGRKGRILVSLKTPSPATLELSVEDDGVGLPQDWENSPSLGWQVVRILAAQLDGSLTAEPSAGTRFVLRFPLVGQTLSSGN